MKSLFILFIFCSYFFIFSFFRVHAQETPLTVETIGPNIPSTILNNSPGQEILTSPSINTIASWVIPQTYLPDKSPIQPIYTITQIINKSFILSDTLEVEDNALELGTKTTGNYQKTTSSGNGISVSGTEGEGWTANVSLGDLGSDWTQNGSHDIVLNNIDSELKILGTDGTYYAILDAGNLSTNTTLIFPSGSDTLVGRESSDTLINKTILANSNTITGLTNANLTGTAGITNANLSNSTVTITAGSGLSNGGTISLGGTVSLTNAGVTSLAGTTNQVNVSGSTGSVTLSLPQNVDTGSSPTFPSINLTSNSNQLRLGTTNTGTLTWSPSTTRILTLPDVTDTLIGKTTIDILTNKTLTSPAINGTVTTTGLTLPAFTAGDINGITIGSTLQPSSTGTLTIKSNSTNSMTVDTGGAAALNLGNTNANALTIGRSSVTTTINGTAAANNLTIGGGTAILKHLSGTASLDFGATAAGTCDSLTITVTGAADGDTVACGIPNALATNSTYQSFECFVSSADTVTVKRCNLTNVLTALGNPSAATVRADVWQH